VNLLRRFVLVGAVATIVDLGLLLGLRYQAGWPVPAADAVAVAAATLVSWLLHSWLTFPGDPSLRWYRRVGAYVAAGAMALLADVAVLTILFAWLRPGWWGALLVIKVPAVLVAFMVRLANYRRAMFDAVRADQSAPAERPAPDGAVRLTVVIPAFREEDRIAATVEAVRTQLAAVAAHGGLEILVADDGSDDRTAEMARAAGADTVLQLSPNRGKGAAVRDGVLAATGRTVAFTDADLSYPPEQITRLLHAVEQGWDVVVGSRQHTDTLTVVAAGRLREFGGRVINVFTGLVLLGRYRDTQCGLKAMRRDVGQLVFSRMQVNGFAFDVELFHLVERYRLTLTEVPVEVVNSERSTVHVVRDAWRLVRDLFQIRSRSRHGAYEADVSVLPAPASP
jgi:dolichyl-phosphate beta-glucosyltransferase